MYPAIDLGPSVSRVMTDIADRPHLAAARVLRRHLATYEENRDLVLMGAYRPGTDAAIDGALAAHPARRAIVFEGTALSYEALDAEVGRDEVVAVDPAVTSGAASDECGIVVAGVVCAGEPKDWRAVVLEDATVRGGPADWARAAIAARSPPNLVRP